MRLYRRFLDGVPEYLARHYWWAYLWAPGSWFFDHRWIINAILFGQYECLMRQTLAYLEPAQAGRILQLTAAYGPLTPELVRRLPQGLDLIDVADRQLRLARSKCPQSSLRLMRMNAEEPGIVDQAFDAVLVFFLFHELPSSARRHVRKEIARIVRPGGWVVVTEYSPSPTHHWLFRMRPVRWLICRLEAFLNGFWHEDHDGEMVRAFADCGKRVRSIDRASCFDGFYRVSRYRLDS